MKSIAVIVWEDGQKWGCALRQLCEGQFGVAVSSDYSEVCRLSSQSPYAVSLWEVNLTNWEERVQQLRAHLRDRPSPGVIIAARDVPPPVVELLREMGALMILEDRLDGMALLRVLERQRQFEPSTAPNWRGMVQMTIPWLNQNP